MSKHGLPPPSRWRKVGRAVTFGVIIGVAAGALFGAGTLFGASHAGSPQPAATATSCHVAVSGHSIAVPSGAVLSQPGTQIGCDSGTVSVKIIAAAPVHVALPPLAAHVLHVWHVMHLHHLAHLAYLMHMRR